MKYSQLFNKINENFSLLFPRNVVLILRKNAGLPVITAMQKVEACASIRHNNGNRYIPVFYSSISHCTNELNCSDLVTHKNI